jgi:hypothetical protein
MTTSVCAAVSERLCATGRARAYAATRAHAVPMVACAGDREEVRKISPTLASGTRASMARTRKEMERRRFRIVTLLGASGDERVRSWDVPLVKDIAGPDDLPRKLGPLTFADGGYTADGACVARVVPATDSPFIRAPLPCAYR